MKIVIQNSETQHYLSAGRWVRTAAEAEDFVAILRAYKFAQEHTTGRFQIVLYCPEAHYITNIIDGMGLAAEEALAPASGVQLPVYCLNAEGGMTAGVASVAATTCELETGFQPAARFEWN